MCVNQWPSDTVLCGTPYNPKMSIILVKYELNCRKKKGETDFGMLIHNHGKNFLSDQPRDRLGDGQPRGRPIEIGSIELWFEGYGHPIHAK